MYRLFVIIVIILRMIFGGIGGYHPTDLLTRIDRAISSSVCTLEEGILASPDAPISDWSIIALTVASRENEEISRVYYDLLQNRISKCLAENDGIAKLSKYKATENAKVVLALSAIGCDPTDIGGADLTRPLLDLDWVCSLSINNSVFSLLALELSVGKCEATDRLVSYILSEQLEDGGWALSGDNSDPDITAMALTALSQYSSNPKVKIPAERAFDRLSLMQTEDGGFRAFGKANSQSAAQVVIALSAWGIDAAKDMRFQKKGFSVLDSLMSFYIPSKGFCDTLENKDTLNTMATEQAVIALSAYEGFIKTSAPYNVYFSVN